MLGIGTLAKKVFGTPNDRMIKAVRPLVAQINDLEDEFAKLDDAGLKGAGRKMTYLGPEQQTEERNAKGEGCLRDRAPCPAGFFRNDPSHIIIHPSIS